MHGQAKLHPAFPGKREPEQSGPPSPSLYSRPAYLLPALAQERMICARGMENAHVQDTHEGARRLFPMELPFPLAGPKGRPNEPK